MTRRPTLRHAAWGTIIEALQVWEPTGDRRQPFRLRSDERFLGALDAVAMLMIASAVDRKERFEDQRDAQRGAREAYDQGRIDGGPDWAY